MSKTTDVAQLSQNKPTSLDGIRGIISFYQSGTADLQDMLINECDIMFECRYCRAIFRSIINFTAHKRQYCKGKFGAFVANQAVLWEQFLDQQPKEEQPEEEPEDGKKTEPRNPVKVINKKSQDIAIPVPGTSEKLIISTLPRIGKEVPVDTQLVGFAASLMSNDELIPSSRVAVTFPQDPSIRSKSSKLRVRRENILTKYSAELPPNELAALHKILRFNPELVDGLTLKCQHPSCTDISPFKNFSIFGYHCGIKHSQQHDGKYLCYICNHTLKQWPAYLQHYTKVHRKVRDEHQQDRLENPDQEGAPKKSNRARSLSPDVKEEVIDEREEEEDEDGEENSDIQSETPPVIQPIDLNDSGHVDGQEDEDENEAPPTLIRMSRVGFPYERISPRKPPQSYSRTRTARLSPHEDKPITPVPQKEAKVPFPSPPETPANGSIVNVETQETEEQRDKKLIRDVKHIVAKLLNNVEDMLGEKVDVSGVRLFGRKRKLRGRAAYLEKLNQLENKKVSAAGRSSEEPMSFRSESVPKESIKRGRKRKNMSPSEVSTTPTESELIDIMAARPSRAKKRPDWMESYHLENDKGAKPVKNEENPGAPAKPETPLRKQFTSPQKRENTPTTTSSQSISGQFSQKERGAFIQQATYSGKGNSASSKKEKNDFVLPEDPNTEATTMNKLKDEIRSPVTSPGSNRRKQDMRVARDKSEEMKVRSSSRAAKPIPADLSEIPVYLSPAQKEIFFAGLKPVTSENQYNDDTPQEYNYICEYCNEIMPSLKEGRRHMVSHIRAQRLRCKLCGCGSFFCNDMRAHLQEGKCPDLSKWQFYGRSTPMTKQEADSLTEIVDLTHPGRVFLTSGKIVSCVNHVPYIPDLEIEEKIIRPHRAYISENKKNSSKM